MNFTLDIDTAIFIGFLAINLAVGLFYSRGIKNIKEYAIGNRNFSTATIAATLVATWIGGDWFFSFLYETYSNGLYFIWPAVAGDVLCFIIIGLFFAPRLFEFLGSLSIAEAMGNLYGKQVRVVTAVAGVIGASGRVAVQLKVCGLLFEYCFNIPSIYGILIGASIVTLYSTMGGIRSVTFTDVIQFFTFGTIIPTIVFFILGTLDNMEVFTTTLSTHTLFNYRKVFDFSQPTSIYYLFLFLFNAIPAFNPAIFQRVAMAKNTKQIRQSFIIGAFAAMFIAGMLSWIGVLILSNNPGLNPNDVARHILFDYSYVGLKGLTLVGVMAMVMSTADSYINSTAILVVHDFCKPLKINLIKDELIFCRLASLIIGSFATLLALRSGSLLQLVLSANMFYMPIVTVPFIMSAIGFRSSGKSVLIGMAAGFIGVVIWEVFFKIANIDGLIPGMVSNLTFLIGSHYLLKQQGGWVGIKDDSDLKASKLQRKLKIKNFIHSVRNFNFITFLRNNSPNSEGTYAVFGIFCIVSTYCTMHTLPKEIRQQYPDIISFIYPSMLFISTLLISYTLWLEAWKKANIIPILWNIAIFYVLICVGFLLVILSKFAHLQLMAFMVNLIVIACLVRWEWALIMMFGGLFTTIEFFKLYLGIDSFSENFISTKVETIYLLLLVSSTLVVFLRPKQEQQSLTEEKVNHLNGRINGQEKELREAMGIRSRFIRNIQHEYHAPMTGVMSTSETLWQAYDKLPDELRKKAAYDIFISSLRLKAFDDNITALSKLNRAGYELRSELINLSDLLHDRIQLCRKLYEEDKEAREFILSIEEGINIDGDKKYLTQALDNIIINSINYCPQGKVTIELKRGESEVTIIFADEGIGIPPKELDAIFDEFVVSSKTFTPAGGRGIGLAVAKRIIEAHGGKIEAESDGVKGSTFKVILPL